MELGNNADRLYRGNILVGGEVDGYYYIIISGVRYESKILGKKSGKCKSALNKIIGISG